MLRPSSFDNIVDDADVTHSRSSRVTRKAAR